MKPTSLQALLSCTAALGLAWPAHAAFVIEIDTDGSVAGNTVTFSPNFSFGGGTTTASVSSATTPAVGLTGGNSIFGGDAVSPALDTYQYSYTVGGDADNLALPGGTPLNTLGDTASGLSAGETGRYAVYAAWPATINVDGGATLFELTHETGTLSISIDQNTLGGQWIPLGLVDLTEGNSYTLVQTAGSNTFVSMRGSGVLFDRIPEPGSTALLGAALGLLALRRRR